MPMSIDATEWLNAHGFGSSWVEGPTLPEPIEEDLRPGDPMEDGTILLNSGASLVGGALVWVSLRGACAASYYGWTVANGRVGRDKTTWEPLYPITRAAPEI